MTTRAVNGTLWKGNHRLVVWLIKILKTAPRCSIINFADKCYPNFSIWTCNIVKTFTKFRCQLTPVSQLHGPPHPPPTKWSHHRTKNILYSNVKNRFYNLLHIYESILPDFYLNNFASPAILYCVFQWQILIDSGSKKFYNSLYTFKFMNDFKVQLHL